MTIFVGRRGAIWPALAVLLEICTPAAASAASRRPVSEIVLDAGSGTILYARDADILRAPASLTKLMTLLLVFDALDAGTISLSQDMRVSRHAAAQEPSRLGLKPGQAISIRSAIRGVAVDSANDAAVALAEQIGGSERAFAILMSRKARQLGLRQTKFANATGLTNVGNRTTAHDVAKLSLALIRQYPNRYSVFATRSIRWAHRTMPNHNHLLGHIIGVDGIKTGYTADAGYNLSASARRRGKRVIVVVLGERSASRRDVRVANLLERGFGNTARPS